MSAPCDVADDELLAIDGSNEDGRPRGLWFPKP